MSDNRGSLDVVLAFAIGGIIGAGVALLLSPTSGQEVRRRIRDEFDDLSDKVKDGYDIARDSVEEGVGKVREFVEEKKDTIKSAISTGTSAFSSEKEKYEEKSA